MIFSKISSYLRIFNEFHNGSPCRQREKYRKWFSIFDTTLLSWQLQGTQKETLNALQLPYLERITKPGILLEVGKKFKSHRRQMKDSESLLLMSICSILQMTRICWFLEMTNLQLPKHRVYTLFLINFHCMFEENYICAQHIPQKELFALKSNY